jgi:MFS family permease
VSSMKFPFLQAPQNKPEARKHFRVILISFVALGFHVGVWAVLLADLVAALGLGPTALGVALAVMTACGVAALLVGGRLADLVGRRPVLLLGVGGTGAFFLLLAAVDGYVSLLIVVAIGGVCASAWDLAVNALGGDHEQQHGSRVMTLLHAGFSGGAALGAILSGVALSSGVRFEAVYATVGLALLGLVLALWRLPLPAPPADGERAKAGRPGGRLSVLFVPAVAACALVIFASFSVDAALEGFLSVYLRDVLLSGALLGGVGISTLYFAGMIGRLSGAVLLGRLGERRVLVLSGVLAALGMAVVSAAGRPSVAAAGLLAVGAAMSPVAPIAFSLTARADPGRSGQAISLVTVSGYGAFTASPLLVGVLAGSISLRFAFLALAAFCLGIALVSWKMPKP